jgi:hypothetical protein
MCNSMLVRPDRLTAAVVVGLAGLLALAGGCDDDVAPRRDFSPAPSATATGVSTNSLTATPTPMEATPMATSTSAGSPLATATLTPGHTTPSPSATRTFDTSLTPTPTPTLPAGRCHDSTECVVAPDRECLEPGGAGGCGACYQPTPCAGDADCFPLQFCDAPRLRPCTCASAPVRVCIALCRDDGDCGIAERCDTGHCVARPCGSAAQCPPLFDCVPSALGDATVCSRRECEADDDCAPAYCVQGNLFSKAPGRRCYDQLGRCIGPTP